MGPMLDGLPTQRQDLEARIGWRFREPALLRRALVHSSFAHEHPGSVPDGDNEQLEFLGDAVLALVIAEGLIARYPTRTEGELSKARSALCSGPSLAAKARDLALGDALLLGRGELKTGGRAKENLLADAYEAVVGAVFRDGGLEAARALVLRHFARDIEGIGHDGAPPGMRDHKSRLQERLQREGGEGPRYEILSEEGPPHERRFRVAVLHGGTLLAEGEGSSKKAAAQSAARTALANLEAADFHPDPAAGEAVRAHGARPVAEAGP